MASNTPSLFKSVAVFSATVLSSATVAGYVAYFNGNTYTAGTQAATSFSGAAITAGGGTFQATNLADAACLKNVVTGKYYNCHQEITLTSGTGGCVAAGCTTRSYNVGSITKPFTGSGMVKEAKVSCGSSTVNTKLTLGFVSATTASGNDLLNRITVGSGAGAANFSGQTLWPNVKNKIKVSTSANIGTTTCTLSIDSDQW